MIMNFSSLYSNENSQQTSPAKPLANNASASVVLKQEINEFMTTKEIANVISDSLIKIAEKTIQTANIEQAASKG